MRMHVGGRSGYSRISHARHPFPSCGRVEVWAHIIKVTRERERERAAAVDLVTRIYAPPGFFLVFFLQPRNVKWHHLSFLSGPSLCCSHPDALPRGPTSFTENYQSSPTAVWTSRNLIPPIFFLQTLETNCGRMMMPMIATRGEESYLSTGICRL